MKRRDFIRNSIGAGIFAGTALTLGNYGKLLAYNENSILSPYDLVAVKGGSPQAMFDKGIAALGGIRAFVKPNQTVVVKPNIGWDAPPERAANTNPDLVKQIVKHCLQAGAKQVYVFDYTCNEWQRCYTNSGIQKAVKEAGGKIVPGNDKKYYQDVVVRGGQKLKKSAEHELILESDVFINVPILKHHGGAGLSISMKNLMGIAWNRRMWHAKGLQQCIADFAYYRRPDLNVVDAYNVLMRNGPQGVSTADVVRVKAQILSTDMVAADAAATKFFDKNKAPKSVQHIKIAHDRKVGNMNLSELNIKRIQV